MRKEKVYKALNITLPIVTLLVIIIVYAIISLAVGIDMLVPSVPSIVKEFFALFAKASFYESVGWTLLRAFIAYVSAFLLAALLSGVTYSFKPLRSALAPIVLIVRIMPTMSLILLALIWFDSFEATVLVAFSVIFPMLYTSFADALEGVDKDLIEMARVYGVSERKQILSLYLPQIAPNVFTAIKSSVGLNLKLVIAAEVLAQTAKSIGIEMQFAKLYVDTAQLLAWTAVAIILGTVFEKVVVLIEKKAVKWK